MKIALLIFLLKISHQLVQVPGTLYRNYVVIYAAISEIERVTGMSLFLSYSSKIPKLCELATSYDKSM